MVRIHIRKSKLPPLLSLEDTVAHIMLRWVLVSSFFIVVTFADLMVFFKNNQLTMFCVLGLSLILALIKTAVTLQGYCRVLVIVAIRMRLIWIACMISIATQLGRIDVDLVLIISAAVLLCLLMLFFWESSFQTKHESSKIEGTAFLGSSKIALAPLLFRNADFLILPWMFPPDQAFIYLMVRGSAGVIGLTLRLLTSKLKSTFRSAFEQGNRSVFVAVAARVNLGLLLIGGGACLAVLSVGPYTLSIFGIGSETVINLIAWVVLAESAPVFFGATMTLLDVTKQRIEAVLIACAGIIVIWASSCILSIKDILELAIIFASARFAVSAVSATILGWRFGILPGLTAILFCQIKLL